MYIHICIYVYSFTQCVWLNQASMLCWTLAERTDGLPTTSALPPCSGWRCGHPEAFTVSVLRIKDRCLGVLKARTLLFIRVYMRNSWTSSFCWAKDNQVAQHLLREGPGTVHVAVVTTKMRGAILFEMVMQNLCAEARCRLDDSKELNRSGVGSLYKTSREQVTNCCESKMLLPDPAFWIWLLNPESA